LESREIVHSILIADDNPRMRSVLVSMLHQEPDLRVVGEAANGLEAISKAQDLKPALILLDLSMPIMNGLEAARELSRILPSTPILLLTSHALDGLREAALAAGVRAVHSKDARDVIQELVLNIRALVANAA